MKGLLVTQRISDSAMDWNHGFLRPIKRLVLPDIPAVVTFDGKGFDDLPLMYIWRGEMSGEYTVEREVEVSDAVGEYVIAFLAAKKELAERLGDLLGHAEDA